MIKVEVQQGPIIVNKVRLISCREDLAHLHVALQSKRAALSFNWVENVATLYFRVTKHTLNFNKDSDKDETRVIIHHPYGDLPPILAGGQRYDWEIFFSTAENPQALWENKNE